MPDGISSSTADDDRAPATSRADWSVSDWVRHPRLEGVLGVRLADVDWSDLERLVSQQTAEDLSIDFKQSHYVLNRALASAVTPKADSDAVALRVKKNQFELAKDVTAFANSSGGLIVIGVAEANGRAHQFNPVELKDKHRLTYLDVIRRWTAPFIGGIEVGHLPSPERNGQGCVLIYVPASSGSPHAVQEPNTHQHVWYVRDGSGTSPLSEAQVAVAYRDRFAGRTDVDGQVRKIFSQGVELLEREGTVWLAVAVAPSRGMSPRALDRQLLEEYKAQTERRQGVLPGARLGHQSAFGRGRVVLRDSQPGAAIKDHLLHLYVDGGAFAAVALDIASDQATITEIRHRRPDLESTVRCIRVGGLTTWVLTLLGIASGHAVDAGGSGDLELLCGIVTATELNSAALAPPRDSAALQHVVLSQPWHHSSVEAMMPATTWRNSLSPVQLTFSAAAASEGRELVTVGAQVVSELVAEFGYVPSDPLLSPDGFVIGENCQGARLEGLHDWAASRGLLIKNQA